MDELIFSYSRKQAIEDGVLVDVTDMAKSYGFVIPVAVTSNLKAEVCEGDEYDNADLGLLLMNTFLAIKESEEKSDLLVCDYYGTTYWCHIGPNDDMSACITLMKPEDY